MKKSRMMLIAGVFTLAIGGAFASRSAKLTTMNYTDTAGCPQVALQCAFPSGTLCSHIFLDPNCSIAAFKRP